jgi:hypothetical protein
MFIHGLKIAAASPIVPSLPSAPEEFIRVHLGSE